ncbi:MAG: cytochrome c [Bacteroidota bacterium]
MEKQKIREEIDFKDLLISPIRLYGWFFVYFFLLILGFGIFFAHKLIPISYNEQTVGIIDSSLVKKEIVEKKGGIIPAVDLKSVVNPTAEMIANGKELYDGNCKSCHGDNGLGDGPAGLMLNPKPRNFHLSDGWTNGRTIDALYKTLHEGIITRGMAAYEYLAPSDRFDIIHYFRTFADFPAVTAEQVNQLNTAYNLSAGTIQPNQIPVSKAAKLILTENAQLNLKVAAAKEKFLSAHNASAGLLLKNVSNIDKALYLFISNPQLSAEQLFWIIKNAPHDYGFKPTITRISLEEFRFFVDYVKSIT